MDVDYEIQFLEDRNAPIQKVHINRFRLAPARKTHLNKEVRSKVNTTNTVKCNKPALVILD